MFGPDDHEFFGLLNTLIKEHGDWLAVYATSNPDVAAEHDLGERDIFNQDNIIQYGGISTRRNSEAMVAIEAEGVHEKSSLEPGVESKKKSVYVFVGDILVGAVSDLETYPSLLAFRTIGSPCNETVPDRFGGLLSLIKGGFYVPDANVLYECKICTTGVVRVDTLEVSPARAASFQSSEPRDQESDFLRKIDRTCAHVQQKCATEDTVPKVPEYGDLE